VRAGAVGHPDQWECCGYREIQSPPDRYRRIDQEALAWLLELENAEEVRTLQQQSVRECLDRGEGRQRRPERTESVAVGDEPDVASVHAELGLAARHRSIQSIADGVCPLRQAPAAYDGQNDDENGVVSPEKTCLP
jgi:putative transposase